MPRQRRGDSTASSTTTSARDVPTSNNNNNNTSSNNGQEMASMYDYLAKIILLGPSGCGKSCLLHRFVKNEWRVLSSQTIGVEFASKIVKIGSAGQRRKRIKLQLWDTAGTERFRSVSRSYYRGAAGAVLVYDVCNQRSFAELEGFLRDARSLGSGHLSCVLVGNKTDLVDPALATLAEEQQLGSQQQQSVVGSLLDDDNSSVGGSLNRQSTIGISVESRQRATVNQSGRVVSTQMATSWASQNRIPAVMEVSALSGDGVEEVFNKLARTILTKIELGEIDPDDPTSGIQYGDADYYRYDDGDSSIKSGGGLTSDGYGSTRRRRRRGGWGEVFKIGRPGSSSGGGGKCC